jgi:hypothetical protein
MTPATPVPISARNLRFAAIDLDGTLLSPELTISAENRRAVVKLQSAGLEVAVASGRHHASIRPFALELPGVRWVISAQGGEVSDLNRTTVLSRTFLSRHRVDAVLAIQKELGMTSMLYTPDGILTDSASNEDTEFYIGLTGLRPTRMPTSELDRTCVFKVVWVANPEVIDAVSRDRNVVAVDAQRVRTHLRLFEFMPVEVSKATGLTVLAQHLGFTAQQAVVFGDADNDIPMFKWAAASFVMPHGWPSAKEHARWIAPDGPTDTAFARAVDVLCA